MRKLTGSHFHAGDGSFVRRISNKAKTELNTCMEMLEYKLMGTDASKSTRRRMKNVRVMVNASSGLSVSAR